MFRQPGLHVDVRVIAVAIRNKVDLQYLGRFSVDLFEKAQPLVSVVQTCCVQTRRMSAEPPFPRKRESPTASPPNASEITSR